MAEKSSGGADYDEVSSYWKEKEELQQKCSSLQLDVTQMEMKLSQKSEELNSVQNLHRQINNQTQEANNALLVSCKPSMGIALELYRKSNRLN